MKYKKAAALVCAAVISVGVLAGCSDKDDSSNALKQDNLYNATKVTETGFTWSNATIMGGGYIPGMVYNESEEGLAYVKTDIGGAYRKKKGEDKWTCITDSFGGEDGSGDWNYTCIESIATDPVEPQRVYMSCGTSYGGDGAIMYSYDYGDHWTKVDFDFNMGGNDWGRNCGERLLIDPNDNSKIYYGSHSNGMFISTDYGKTWNELSSFPVKGSYTEGSYSYGILWITADKSSAKSGEATKRIFAGVAESEGAKIYVTEDAGKTWEPLKNDLTDDLDNIFNYFPCQGRYSADGNLYVTYSSSVTQEKNPTRGKVCKYNLKNKEWKDITPFTGTNGLGYCGIALYKDEMVAVTTICNWSSVDNIVVSRDSGETWVGLWNKTENGTTTKDYTLDISDSPWLDWQGQLKLGWWTSGVAINPFNPDELIYGTGATLFGTDNLTKIGEEKVNIKVMAQGIEETAIFKLYSPKDCGDGTPELYSTLGDLYGFRHDDVTKAPNEHWGVYSFKADDLAVAAADPNIVVRTTKDSSGVAKNSICYSTDGTKTWQFVESLPEGIDKFAGGNVTLSADGKTLLYIPDSGSYTTFVTDDWGKTWTASEGLGVNPKIVADGVNPDKFYAVSGSGIYISKNKGKTFEIIASTMVSNLSITVNKEVEGDLWISISSGPVYYIENADVGAELKLVEGDIDTSYSVSVGAPEKEGEYGAIYIYGSVDGKGEGVYQSNDKGKTWVKMNNENEKWGNVNRNMLEADPKTYGRVYLSTNGRGIIMSDVKK